MAVIEAGQPAPEFSLARAEGGPFTRADLEGRRTLLVFYPFAFSSVCTDQLSLYDDLRGDFAAHGVTLYGVSCDADPRSRRSSEQLGIEIEQLSDFEPKGEACRAFGVLHPGGFPQRALVLIGRDGVVEWSYEAASPRRSAGREPDLRRARGPAGLSNLGSAPLPPVGPADHVRGPDVGAPRRRLRRLRVPVLRRARAAAARAAAARGVPPLPGPLEPSARLARGPRGGGGGAPGALLGDARRAVRRPGAPRGPASVGARGAARARRRALRRRPPHRARRGADRRRLPRRRARGGGDDADAVRRRRAPCGAPGPRGARRLANSG